MEGFKIERQIEGSVGRGIEKINNSELSLDIIERTRKFVGKFALFLEENPELRGDFDILKSKGALGSGGAGSVFAINDAACLKVMDNRKEASNFHTYDNEALIAKEINGLHTDLVRVPEFFAYYRTEHNREMLMERIHGFTLKNIFDGNGKFPEKFLERYYDEGGFDYDSFDDNLNEFLDKMHDKGVLHGDLASRNIMIDMDGKIVVIDTGASKFINHLKFQEKKDLMENEDDEIKLILEEFRDFFKKINVNKSGKFILHYNLESKDCEIKSEIFSDSILDIVKDFVNEENKISNLTEVVNGLYVSPNKEDLVLGLKSVDYGGDKYFIGFKKEEG